MWATWLLILVITPSVAVADTGIPMLALAWPTAWVTLAPVVLIEALLARRLLTLSWKESAWLSLRANAWSTLVGIPLAWLLMLAIQILGTLGLVLLPSPGRHSPWSFAVAPLFSAWVPPTHERWPIFAAGCVLCLPFYAVSVKLEARMAETVVPREAALRWARTANRTTYALFAAGLLVAAIVAKMVR